MIRDEKVWTVHAGLTKDDHSGPIQFKDSRLLGESHFDPDHPNGYLKFLDECRDKYGTPNGMTWVTHSVEC